MVLSLEKDYEIVLRRLSLCGISSVGDLLQGDDTFDQLHVDGAPKILVMTNKMLIWGSLIVFLLQYNRFTRSFSFFSFTKESKV